MRQNTKPSIYYFARSHSFRELFRASLSLVMALVITIGDDVECCDHDHEHHSSETHASLIQVKSTSVQKAHKCSKGLALEEAKRSKRRTRSNKLGQSCRDQDILMNLGTQLPTSRVKFDNPIQEVLHPPSIRVKVTSIYRLLGRFILYDSDEDADLTSVFFLQSSKIGRAHV